jgi:hypothetical protein
MKKLSIGLLLAFAVFDAYALSHPNLLGRVGVLFYDYWYIQTFPKAFITIALTIGLVYFGSILIKNKLSARGALLVVSLLLAVVLLAMIQTFLKFSAGTYAHTGSLFKWGAKLLPVVLSGILLQRWYEIFRDNFAGKK